LDAVLAPIARYFKFAERGTNIITESRAGITTFMVMSYIIFVNPGIISSATKGNGPDFMATVVATCLAAGIMTLAMGLVANYPFAMAAGLGINAVVAYDLINTRHMVWQDAMAVIAWEGIIITILVVTGLRQAVVRAIPMSLKRAIGIGIGMFILFIGLSDAGFVVQGSGTPVTLGNFVQPTIVVFVFGLALALGLMARKVPGAPADQHSRLNGACDHHQLRHGDGDRNPRCRGQRLHEGRFPRRVGGCADEVVVRLQRQQLLHTVPARKPPHQCLDSAGSAVPHGRPGHVQPDAL